ncbi:MAG: alpha/beta hydrolase-fold protein [Acidobacteriota bacterium]
MKKIFNPPLKLFFLCLTLIFFLSLCQTQNKGQHFAIYFSEDQNEKPLDGRMLLMISSNNDREPRFQISDGPDTQMIFGIDVNGLKPGEMAVIDKEVFGYPLESVSEIPPGEYWIQGLFNLYETFDRSDEHTVKLPPDKGEGQVWNRKPGNFYSTPKKVNINPQNDSMIEIQLDQKIPSFEEGEDTKYIKHIKIKSDLLTKFWGRPMYLGAIILLPEGFQEHPEAKYPLMIYQGHFHRTFYTPVGFRESPPDESIEPEYNERFDLKNYNQIVQQYSYNFYKDWTGPDFPRMIIVTIQHPNPYYDDSYAVNSANLGPYGDALTYELIPYIEENFRGIGEGWARVLYGGSTGGWESLAVQIFYPDEYNGCWSFCPDPIDFRAYTIVNIYENKNAYFLDSEWKKTPRPGRRNFLGEVSCTLEESNHKELVIGTHGRSGGQWDIWQAVFGPVGKDGYPKPIWDKMTGEIDSEVAEYWRKNYDLRDILERDWETLGSKLKGKINIYCGDMDNYYLNNAVYLMEEFLESTTDPYYDGEIDYGDRAEHCWSGDHENPNYISRLTINQRIAPKVLKHLLDTAPPGADTTSWRY